MIFIEEDSNGEEQVDSNDNKVAFRGESNSRKRKSLPTPARRQEESGTKQFRPTYSRGGARKMRGHTVLDTRSEENNRSLVGSVTSNTTMSQPVSRWQRNPSVISHNNNSNNVNKLLSRKSPQQESTVINKQQKNIVSKWSNFLPINCGEVESESE